MNHSELLSSAIVESFSLPNLTLMLGNWQELELRPRDAKENFPGTIARLDVSVWMNLSSLLPQQLAYLRTHECLSARVRRLTPGDLVSEIPLIHFDNGVINFLHFLETPHPSSPTTFLRHLATGSVRASIERPTHLLYQTLDFPREYERAWEEWYAVVPERGTTVVFDGHLFHMGPRQLTGDRWTLEVSLRRTHP
jgi:hypothetical protein